MSDQRLTILIVDDNDDNCELLEDIFEQDYQVKSVSSGKICLEALESESYDLILLDVNMPNMDGYEVCRRIKKSKPTALTPVIFVSALASTEERLKGYEAGGEDYVTKPFKSADIKATVERVIKQIVATRAFETQSKEAMQTAYQAMANSAELGHIVQYLQQSYQCKSIEQLSKHLLSTTNSYGLNCCLLFKMQFKKAFVGCQSDSIEGKVLEHFCTRERILDFGSRTLINDEHVSLLVKNMPLDKPDDYGRIKDNLTVLVCGTEARCKALDAEHQLEEQRNLGLQSVLVNSQDRLQEIHNLVDEQKFRTQDVLDTISVKIEKVIFSLGLDEEQERVILSAIEKGVDEMNMLTQYSDQLETSFHGFVNQLSELAAHRQ
jgi:CheY-like chemotaxis protein